MAKKKLTKEERIDHIVDMMRDFRFIRGTSIKRLAEEWGVHIQTLKCDAAEAQRIVRREIEDHERVGYDVGKALQLALKLAEENALNLEPGSRGQIKAIDQLQQSGKVWSDIMGKTAPIRVDSTNVELTPAEAQAKAKERFGQVAPEDQDENESAGDTKNSSSD